MDESTGCIWAGNPGPPFFVLKEAQVPGAFFFFVFLGPHPRHMLVPRLGVESERLLPAYATAAVTPDPSRVCSLHHSSRQRRILNPLSEARERTRNLMVPSRISFRCAKAETPPWGFFSSPFY